MQGKKPFLIDCQLFQTFSWDRGMGKYSMELLQAVLSRKDFQSYDVKCIFNQNLKRNSVAEKRIHSFSPNAEFVFLELDLPKEDRLRENVQQVRLKNKNKLNQYISSSFESYKPNFLILSLYLDEVCSVFPDSERVDKKSLIYYDSIPFLYHERYGRMPGFFDHYYIPHTATIFESDIIFTISKTVANDLHLYFGVLKEKITNIDGAPIPRSVEKAQKPTQMKYQPGKFVLMPTGQELRKNNDRAVEGFEKFLSKTGKKLTLVITSHFSNEGKEYLRTKSQNVDFSGNVTESELLWMYQNCRYVLFPSEYEGLGLPVLEAVEQGKKVVCSDISVFREMSEKAFTYFDPLDVQSITEALEETERELELPYDKKEYDQLMKKYSWSETARRFIEGLSIDSLSSYTGIHKKKIAIFAPDVSGFSAIGKDIGELHDIYSQYFDIDYYFDRGPNHRLLRPNYLKYVTNCFEARSFTAKDREKYDALVYHIGNSEYHTHIVRVALAFPGYMVLHDTNLSGLYNNLLEDGFITKTRFAAEQELEKKISFIKTKDSKKSEFIASLVNSQKAVVVHSQYARAAVRAKLIEQVDVSYLELPFSTPVYPVILKKKNKEKITIAFAGIIAPIKGIDIMEQIASDEYFSNCEINIFGFSATFSTQLKKLDEYPNVNVIRNPSDFDFQRLLIESDVMINVRLAYKGETSGSTLSHMRYGGVAVVRNFGWFSELPDEAVVKVDEPEATITALKGLVEDRSKLSTMSEKSLQFMEEHHSHQAYAKGMYGLVVG